MSMMRCVWSDIILLWTSHRRSEGIKGARCSWDDSGSSKSFHPVPCQLADCNFVLICRDSSTGKTISDEIGGRTDQRLE